MVTLLLGACGSDTPPAASPSSSQNAYEATREQGVLATLTKLTAAERAGDVAAATALVDASATPAFRESVARTARAFATVGIGTAQYRVQRDTGDGDRSGQLGQNGALGELTLPTEVQQRLDAQGSTDSWVVPTVLRYQFAGVDEAPTSVSRPLVMARYGDSWTVVGDAGPVLGTGTPRPQFWDYDGVRAQRVSTAGGTSIVLDYPGSRSLGDRIRSGLPGAVGAVTAFWGAQWPRRTVVIATDTSGAFVGLARAQGDTAAAAAATVSGDDTGTSALGQRVVFTPGAVDDLPGAALDVVLRHELTHVAARPRTADTAPKWLTEGVAEYVGRSGTYRVLADAAPDLAAQVRSGRTPTALPDDAAFAVSGPDAQIAYQTAWSFAAFAAQAYTPARLRALYLRLAGGPSTAQAQSDAMSATLGAPGDAVLDRWRVWLTTSAAAR
ncbi:Peptidase MA superfamily [Williamsia deligens]|nr:Peptidase MA superfamily [Williamsia deligens]